MRQLLIPLAWLSMAASVFSCPWCKDNPAMKPTINKGDKDPGGLYFGHSPDPAKVRRYFIAAEPVLWDYLPQGADPLMGRPIPPHVLSNKQALKHVYRQYADETFTRRVLPDERLGIMGPVMRGMTGDFIVVTLLNRLPAPVSLHPHGVRYDKDSEGSSYLPGRGMGASIAPEARFTYVWHLDEASAPGPNEPSSKPWLYHSHVMGDEEINAGLSGFIIVTDAKRARPDGTPSDVDREMALLFENYDESGVDESAEYANPTTVSAIPPTPWPALQEQRELAMRHAINGRIFGNASGLEMKEGERVRWYLFALGNEADVHTAHWHGARLRDSFGRGCDVIGLMPGSMTSADMLAENPGDWMIHCHVGEHMMEGMYGKFTVHRKAQAPALPEPFLGLTGVENSLEWLAAETELKPGAFRLKARCKVTAYANLSVWTTRIGLKLGDREVSVIPDRSGKASAAGATCQVLNADELGVVRSEQIEMEITLVGAGWEAEAQKTLSDSPHVPLQVTIDSTGHGAPLRLVVDGDKAKLAR